MDDNLIIEKTPEPVKVKKSLLKADEVVQIIRECSMAGVSEVRFGNLYVKFGGELRHYTPAEADNSKVLVDTSVQIAKETFEKDEIALREQQVAELILTDPYEFENQLASGDLEDESRPSDEEV